MEPTGPAMLSCLIQDLDPAKLRGRLLVAPLAYANALRCGHECEPIPSRKAEFSRKGRWNNKCPYGLNRNTCGRNLNRLWPGDEKGSICERLAAAIWRRVVRPAEYVVDFHCWQDWSPPGALVFPGESEELGRYVGISCMHVREAEASAAKRKTLAAVAALAGKVALTIEYTPQTRINPDMASNGEAGVRNLMKRIGMLRGRAKQTDPLYYPSDLPVDDKHFEADCDLLARPMVKPEQWVRKGQPLARLVPVDRPDQVSLLRAPYAGVIFHTSASAALRKGESIMNIRRARVVRS